MKSETVNKKQNITAISLSREFASPSQSLSLSHFLHQIKFAQKTIDLSADAENYAWFGNFLNMLQPNKLHVPYNTTKPPLPLIIIVNLHS